MTGGPLIAVACGVLVGAGGNVLIAQRPPGKLAAGKWEFPGGKIEAGETPRRALARELLEELGIEVLDAEPLLRFRHDYEDRSVVLDTWRVTEWHGALTPQEGQRLQWCAPDAIAGLDILPTVMPTVRALRLPAHYVFTPPFAALDFLLERLPGLPAGALLRLRLPDRHDDDYQMIARSLLEPCRQVGVGLMLDRDPAFARQIGAAGWHGNGRALAGLMGRSLDDTFIIAVSAHDSGQLAAAQRLQVDCAVLGPVLPTPSHPDSAGLGWQRFAEVRGTATPAVYAIGGLGAADLETARRHGAQGVAGISAWWADKPEKTRRGTGA